MVNKNVFRIDVVEKLENEDLYEVFLFYDNGMLEHVYINKEHIDDVNKKIENISLEEKLEKIKLFEKQRNDLIEIRNDN